MAAHDLSREPRLTTAARGGIVVADWAYAIPQWFRAVLGRERSEELLEVEERCGADVVLLPGIWNTWRFQMPLARALHERGHRVHTIGALGGNGRSLSDSVEIVTAHLLTHDLSGVVLVAHSKGGLIAKQLLLDPRTKHRLHGAITMGTPFAGSTLAQPIRWSSPLEMFRPDSPEVTRLAREASVNPHIVALSAAWDEMVPNGAGLPGALNVTLAETGHFLPLTAPEVHDMIHGYVHDLSGGEPPWK